MIAKCLISVVMPVYNAERYVAKAVESILNQTFRDFELIIIDDGSRDGSLRILRSYAEKDDRIRLVNRENRGIVSTLNEGLRMARGAYIARMDADDRCEANRFALQLQRLEAEPELVAVGSCGVAIDPEGDLLGDAPLPLTHEEIEAQHLKGISSIFHPAVMMRAEAVRRVGGYREGTCPCEDLDLWLRLGEVGRVANLPERLFIWRRTVTGIVASSMARMRDAIERVLVDAWERRRLPGRPEVPAPPVMSKGDLYRQWGWVALKNRETRVARKYAAKSLWEEPGNGGAWRLAFCAIRAR